MGTMKVWGYFALMLCVSMLLAGCGGGSDADTASDGEEQKQSEQNGDADHPANAQNGGAAVPASNGKLMADIKTTLGTIVVELDQDKAPKTTDNFKRYAEGKYYDGTVFHEIRPGYIMGGGYDESLTNKVFVGKTLENEADNGLKNVAGTIAMARDPNDKDSAELEFFINVTDNPQADYKDETDLGFGYCVFGKVTPESMPIVQKIADTQVQEREGFEAVPVQTVKIESITIR